MELAANAAIRGGIVSRKATPATRGVIRCLFPQARDLPTAARGSHGSLDFAGADSSLCEVAVLSVNPFCIEVVHSPPGPLDEIGHAEVVVL